MISQINQVTKYVEIPQIRNIHKVTADVIKRLMQRQAPQLQTVAKTVGVPPVPFIGRMVDVLVIKQLMLRQVPQIQTLAKIVAVPFDDRVVEAPLIMYINQLTKHVEIPPVVMQQQVPQVRTVLVKWKSRWRSSSGQLWKCQCHPDYGVDATTGLTDPRCVEDCGNPAGAARQDSGGCARDHADHAASFPEEVETIPRSESGVFLWTCQCLTQMAMPLRCRRPMASQERWLGCPAGRLGASSRSCNIRAMASLRWAHAASSRW